MAWQAENKLARAFTVPDAEGRSLTLKAASHLTFKRLASDQDKRLDAAGFQQIVARHAGGLKVLKNLGDGWGNPASARVTDGSQQQVTSQLLHQLVDAEFRVGDPVKLEVEAVLACLEALAQQLQEDLFVSV
ncbi:hypothetical protein TSOC_013215 [Tetrabaena socialis]|uniref:Uncharacterized protein n=1 Tax=Tetrabaena socialis TaxID=47790 RepID=A0A2J7ZKZ2_9CHLO|nr:hypothetical protein TSOC_013215 [Tetrabaena socialis]|eukprot:PNH00937.1 hypothetical protein TSOC_013215 [Tetrabaena socialis]